MKKHFFLVLGLSILCCNLGFGQKYAQKANRVTALRCLKLAENCLMGKDYQNAYNQAVLGLSYDDSVSDLSYVIAASEYNMGASRNKVISDLEKAFEKKEWVNYSNTQARILLADLYSDTNRYEESLNVLDEVPFIYSADAEFIRVKNYYRIGTDESWNEARLKINASRRIYPDDKRFPVVFFVFENLRKKFCQVYKIPYEIPEIVYNIAEAYLPYIPDYSSASQNIDIELLAANFASEDVKQRLVKSILSKSKIQTPLLVTSALECGVYTQKEAFTKFFESTSGEIDILSLEFFLSQITEPDVVQNVCELLTNYEGKILVDENLDLQYEVIVNYKLGRPDTFSYDFNNDGIFEYEGQCDLGAPRYVYANNRSFELFYEDFPCVNQLELFSDNIIFSFAPGDFSYVPFLMKKNEILGNFNVDFYIPCMFSNPDLMISPELNKCANTVTIPIHEKENCKAVYQTFKGNVVNVKFFENDVQYGYANFEDGLPFVRLLDNNLDGIFETTEVYKSIDDSLFSEDERNYFKENNKADDIFGGLVSDIYLSKISIDSNLNSKIEFQEEYLPFDGKIICWDNDDDGILDSKYIRHPVLNGNKNEEIIFYDSTGNEIINININNDIPVKMISADHEIMIYAGKLNNLYWISDEGDAALEKEIYSIVKNKIPQGVIGIYSVGEKRVSVIRVENNYFCRLIPENSIENE